MRQMTSERMFDNGKYFVIYLLPESVEFDELKFFLWTKNDHEEVMKRGNSCENLESYEDQLMAWKSLILVSESPYKIDTTDFADTVRKYNNMPPFNFKSSEQVFSFPFLVNLPLPETPEVHISIYAAHLYDSVILYAKVETKPCIIF